MEKKRVVTIIQAHMGSSRLPGKVLKDICGMPALYRMIERVRQSELVDEVVVAVSTGADDDILVEKCNEWGVSVFRGSNDDVLARFWGAAQAYPAENYMRLTSDCPLIDVAYMDKVTRFFLDNNYRYVRHAEDAAEGYDTEVFTAELLQETAEKATEEYEHIHVTPYMFTKQDSVFRVPYGKEAAHLRLTLDTYQDYELIQKVYAALYTPGNTFTGEDIWNFFQEHPEVLDINGMVEQKHFTDVT